MDICAVIVTFNRKELLQESVEAVINQTVKVKDILIIDNNSTDGTIDVLNNLKGKYNNLSYISLDKNIGGAGGFNIGINEAVKRNSDYIWIMDDDTIPNEDALEKLMHSKVWNENWSFLCSKVLWTDKSICKMNIPNYVKYEYQKDNLINRVNTATFVSLLIKSNSVKEIGLPIKEFFIWGDDFEYTSRLSELIGPGYCIENSIVIHKMKENKSVNIISDNRERIPRYYYEFRNKYFILRKQKKIIEYYKYFIKTNLKVIIIKNSNKIEKIKVLFKALNDGIKFNPKIEYID